MAKFPEVFEDHISDLNTRDANSRAIGLYTGEIIANNDPQQMGRCRVLIHGIDEEELEIKNYRWTPVLSSLMGVQVDSPMGPNKDETTGITSYGKFEIPKVGSIALIMFIGGRLSNPIILGSIIPNDLISGLPGGNRGKNEFDENGNNNNITRLKTRLDTAFGSTDSVTKDTRGFEVTARAPGERTGVPDVTDVNRRTGDITQDRAKSGYPKTLAFTPQEGPNNEPMMYSYTTPAQNTFLLNDDPDNFRIRLRTLSGNQVILDDTNERIYISTGRGNSYIEMDEDGHIEIYSAHRISVHGEQDINIKSDKQVNIEGTQGINLKSSKDINLQTSTSISQKAGKSIYINAGINYHVDAAAVFVEATTGDLNLRATGDLLGTATSIHLNGPPAVIAEPAGIANSVNRIPLHESNDWRAISSTGVRSDTVSDAHDDKQVSATYTDKSQGGKISIPRLANWRK